MSRNGGALIDTADKRVRERNGRWYDVESMVVTPGGVYHASDVEPTHTHWWHHERWVLREPQLVINRWAFHPHHPESIDWYIETDIVEVDGDEWRIRDGYLDVFVHEGVRYHVDDADELADGIAHGELPLDEALTALRSFSWLCHELRRNGCSGLALLREHAPDLPAPRIARGEDGIFRLAS